ncbi:flavodoxin [Bacillus carboniphilus]|uniref:Flavodoxin n=1 Tax=Bacillus carboniphilus TaxID=86663 RepID=A0ABP3GF71_9BACI
MRIAIVYTSVTGNTEEVAVTLHSMIGGDLIKVQSFDVGKLCQYDAVLVGTYTWGSGEIPVEMRRLYEAFEQQTVEHLVTGVFGTGDRCFAHFCGAVDRFRDMLAVHTNLAVTLKIEQRPQPEDIAKCQKFVELVGQRGQEPCPAPK